MARPDLFTHTLNLLRGGEAQAELSEQLDHLITACAEPTDRVVAMSNIIIRNNELARAAILKRLEREHQARVAHCVSQWAKLRATHSEGEPS